MSTLGMGACGLGSTAAGVGYTAPINSTAARVLVQPDGSRGDCGRINAVTGDHVLSSTGERVGWDSTSQRVYLALRTALGSSAVATLGIDLPTGGVLTDNTIAKIRLAVLAALSKLTADGSIEVLEVLTTRTAVSGVQTEVRWKALDSGNINSTFT